MLASLFTLSHGYDTWYFIVVWVYHIFTLTVIFSPFLVIRKFQTVKWMHVVSATLLAFLTFLFIYWIVDVSIFRWDGWARYFKNYDYLIDQFRNEWVGKSALFTFILLPLSAFYSIWLIYKEYNWRRFLLAAGYALVILGFMVAYQVYTFIKGLQAFFYHFN